MKKWPWSATVSKCCVWINLDDALCLQILQERGYAPGKWIKNLWRRHLDSPIHEAAVPQGYTIRFPGDLGERPARSWASWLGCHPNEPDGKSDGWQWYHYIQRVRPIATTSIL